MKGTKKEPSRQMAASGPAEGKKLSWQTPTKKQNNVKLAKGKDLRPRTGDNDNSKWGREAAKKNLTWEHLVPALKPKKKK